MAANPPADLQEPAKRTGDTPVGDLESVTPRPMDPQGGDLNAPQPAHNGADGSEWSKVMLLGSIVLSVLILTPALVYFALNYTNLVIKILACSFAGVVSVTLLLLLVGWTCGYGKMLCTGLWLFRMECFLVWLLFFFVVKYEKKKRG